MVFGWEPGPDEPGEADHPLEPEDEPEELEEDEPDDDEPDVPVELEEPVEPELPEPDVELFEPVEERDVAVWVAARAAIEPARPRNVRTLKAAATTRERRAAWRRLRGAGRRGVWGGSSGGPSHRNPGASMSSPRVAACIGGELGPRP